MKVLNKYKDTIPADAVYIGRPSKFGNPFNIRPSRTREEAILMYREWIKTQPEIIESARKELKGKSLVCFCAPKPCHGDVLMEIANQ